MTRPSLAITTNVFSAGGQTAGLTTPIRFTGCDKLAFAPKLALKLTGAKEAKVGGRIRSVGLAFAVLPVETTSNAVRPAAVQRQRSSGSGWYLFRKGVVITKTPLRRNIPRILRAAWSGGRICSKTCSAMMMS